MRRIDPIHITGADGGKGMSIVGIGSLGSVMIVTGKSTVADSMHWSAMRKNAAGEWLVSVQRLFKGRYADAVVKAVDLLAALKQAGCEGEAESLNSAMKVW